MPDRDFSHIARRLRRGGLVVDRVFDEVFPLEARAASRIHWSPLEVAVRAARLLAHEPGARLLDVGAGVGKFCLAAAALGARVRGVEHRERFVAIARTAAKRLRLDVDFACATVDGEDVRAVDGVYLFNPFAENLCPSRDQLDHDVRLDPARFEADVRTTERLLDSARSGTRVVTYCGFGAPMPASYRLVSRELCAGGPLELWLRD